MEDLTETTILIPIDARDPVKPATDVARLFGAHSLLILGTYDVPDQATTDQLRTQFGEEATAAVESVAEQFELHGGVADSRVVFTHDRSETVERVAAEADVDAVLTESTLDTDLTRVLVPLRGDDNLERIVAFVGQLMRESDATVTLLNVATSDDEASQAEFILRGARDRLIEDGINGDRVDWQQERDFSPTEGILRAATEHDLVVVGESEPSLRERLLGAVTNQVVDESPVPVLVVRNP